MIDTSKKTTFKQVLYIWYPVWFRQKKYKNKNNNIRALIALSSKANAIHPTYTIKLGLCAKKIDVIV